MLLGMEDGRRWRLAHHRPVLVLPLVPSDPAADHEPDEEG
jgi:hypothetical protein